MLRREWWRAVGVAAVSAVLVGGSAVAAHAAPAPDNGPEAGGTTVTVTEPVGVAFTSVTTGSEHSVAVGSDGNAYAWGRNTSGQLGDGTTTSSSVPVRVQAPAGVTFTGVAAGDEHSVAVGSDGNAYAWGRNTSGQLGDGTTTSSSVPVRVQAPAGVTFTGVTAGGEHSVAVGSDGNAYAWGHNGDGQLGDGTTTDRNVPVRVQVPAGVTFTSVTAASYHSVAVSSDGDGYAWGDNNSGQLGDGTTTNRNVPVRVQAPAGVTFTSITGGWSHSVAVGSDDNAYAWGYNAFGQLGDGTTTSRSVPVRVQAPAGVTFTSVTPGVYHSVAVGSDGNAYAWGHNGGGQLGDGTTTYRNVPVRVLAPAGVTFTSITGGWSHSVAVGSDGNAYAWGYNAFGQLGDGTDALRRVPVRVHAPRGVVASVSFDGIAGSNLVDNGDGTWSVDSPAHAVGPVDVVVSWTLNGTTQSPVTYPNGFTYTPTPVAPTITDPVDQFVTAGETATFTVTTTGTPTPTVTWEVSRDGGDTWDSVATDPAATPSGDGLMLTVVTEITHNGYLYRATADNGVGGPASSRGATLTVTPVPVAPTITDPVDQFVTAGETATFTVTTTGTPTPTVTWEVSRNYGYTWDPVTTDPAATPSGDGLTLTVVARLTHTGNLYRATADNGVGAPATSRGATLIVTPARAQCRPYPWGGPSHSGYTSTWTPPRPCNPTTLLPH